ncbi:hypothetical protein HanRHA438_Chr05g0241201 [Helianthus annuus]|uniref:Myb/SANT-like domain-containing protein n=2 Tax=Helianthus annuus TaxID=4232 RepID=A0A9K3J2R7_HELAN|nr:hypothetical protein HanXRQr2_Chr05g0231911 [Helianthus annuus]KAJ0585797.1 hypothetical protein HanHA89_Chr05g0204751 [Helianthus annuus]KAJ0920429.1 hypothetical protein HanRHA438_Chr05g0241201 [Helianthus annuus]
MLMQRGCRWDYVDNKINCEKHWYDDWCKDHNNAVGLWNLKFPYLYKLDSLWGTNIATQLKTEDISQACENNNDENIGVATKSDSWGDEKLEEIIDALLNVSLADEDVGRAAELCYKDPDKAKLLFALPSPIKRSYVMSFLYPGSLNHIRKSHF